MERNLLSYEEILTLKAYKGFRPFLAVRCQGSHSAPALPLLSAPCRHCRHCRTVCVLQVCWALEEAQRLIASQSALRAAQAEEKAAEARWLAGEGGGGIMAVSGKPAQSAAAYVAREMIGESLRAEHVHCQFKEVAFAFR